MNPICVLLFRNTIKFPTGLLSSGFSRDLLPLAGDNILWSRDMHHVFSESSGEKERERNRDRELKL